MNFLDTIKHPVRAFNKHLLKGIIKEALEQLPELKQKGLNILKEHKDEFIAAIKEAILNAVEKFIDKIINKEKAKIVETTGNPN